MDRREFLKKGIFYGTTFASSLLFSGVDKLFSLNNLFSKSLYPDLVAIKGPDPVTMFDKAIAALGGMGSFVKKGQTVVVKPNIGWDVTPELAGNTNPKLVGRIIEHCFTAGAKKVWVFDHTCNDWKKTYKNSGIESAVKNKGGEIVPAHTKSYYHNVSIPKGQVLKDAMVHELIMQADVFINVPILKNHGSADLTIAMKNLMGIVWDRQYYHKNDLHQCIADFTSFRKPDLNIVDAYRVMLTNGPRGVSEDDVTIMKTQLISTDIVAIDAAAAKVFGKNPSEIPYIKIANDMKLGNMNLDQLDIKRITI